MMAIRVDCIPTGVNGDFNRKKCFSFFSRTYNTSRIVKRVLPLKRSGRDVAKKIEKVFVMLFNRFRYTDVECVARIPW